MTLKPNIMIMGKHKSTYLSIMIWRRKDDRTIRLAQSSSDSGDVKCFMAAWRCRKVYLLVCFDGLAYRRAIGDRRKEGGMREGGGRGWIVLLNQTQPTGWTSWQPSASSSRNHINWRFLRVNAQPRLPSPSYQGRDKSLATCMWYEGDCLVFLCKTGSWG